MFSGAAATYTVWHLTVVLAGHDIVPELLYAGSVIIGFGASLIWAAQGLYLTSLTTPCRLASLQGMFSSILMTSPLVGQSISLIILEGFDSSESTIFDVMLGISALASLAFLFVRPWPATTLADLPLPRATPDHNDLSGKGMASESVWTGITRTLGLAKHRVMFLLHPLFVAAAFEQTLFFGVFTERLDSSTTAVALLAAAGGAMVASALLGRLADKFGYLSSVAVLALLCWASCLFAYVGVEETGGDTSRALVVRLR